MNQKPDLKACPCCGSAGVLSGWFGDEDTKPDDYFVRCVGCGLQTEDYADEVGAVIAWNTRV